MPVRLHCAVLPSADPAAAAAFWSRLLDRPLADGGLLPGDDVQVGLRFVPRRGVRTAPDRVHLHVTSTDDVPQPARVAAAAALGATQVDVGQLPEEDHVVLADPAGAAFCVIEEGNRYLAGCGPLGELACDGTRDVGVFWSAALDWPLVWDADDETAVQSPLGGTKVAWGGPPVAPVDPADPPLFELVVDGDLTTEVERLLSLGATRRDDGLLADPDGAPFRLVG